MSILKNCLHAARAILDAGFLTGLFLLPHSAMAQSWQVEWDRALEAAKKEGKVVVGVQPGPEIRAGLEKRWAERFKGIELELRPGSSSVTANRIASEHKAGAQSYDVFFGSGSALALAADKVLDPFEPFMIRPEIRDSKNWFGGHIWADNVTTKRFIYTFHAYLTEAGYYNPDLLKPEEIRSYDDLLNPKWKGKIGIFEPRVQGAGQAIWLYLWKVKGESFLKRLVEQDLLVSADHRQLGDLLAKGRLALSMGPTYYTLLPYLQAGIPLKPLPTPKEGIHATVGSGALSLVKNAPHPNAAKIFINWILSKEGQEIFGKATGQGSRRLDVDTNWLKEIGVQAAKDVLTVEEYLARESFFESGIPLRQPAVELAKRLLK